MSEAKAQEKNRPCPTGRALGKELARLADKAFADQKKHFPKMQERCESCAFRGGTFPNGCLETVSDALKSTMEGREFMCHQKFDEAGKPVDICIGWFVSYSAVSTSGLPLIATPWPYSHEVAIPELKGDADNQVGEGNEKE